MKKILILMMLALSLFVPVLASEDVKQVSAQDQAIDKALLSALNVATNGPAKVELLDEATLSLPKDFIFIPRKQAIALLSASGNAPSSTFVGLIMPKDSAFHWLVPVDFVKSGYIKDQALKWQSKDLLKALQKNTEFTNKVRAADGFPTITIAGWQQQPIYQPKQHELTWALQGIDSEAYRFVNYNTEVLGRDGYFEFTLLSQNQTLKASKEEASKIISTLEFKDGKRYDDFVSGSDAVADFGLAALVIGKEAATTSGWTSLLLWFAVVLVVAGITFSYVRVR